MEPAHLLGAERDLPHLGHRQRRGVGGEDRAARRRLVELAEHLPLDLDPLRRSLDHEVDVAEAVVGGGAGDQPADRLEALVGLLLRELLLLHDASELALRHLARLREARIDEPLLDVL